MSRAVFSPLAEQDLAEIQDYISRDKPEAAAKFIESPRETCSIIASQPDMGRSRPEFRGGNLRSFPVGNYLIFYRSSADGVEIARVVHGARDIESIL